MAQRWTWMASSLAVAVAALLPCLAYARAAAPVLAPALVRASVPVAAPAPARVPAAVPALAPASTAVTARPQIVMTAVVPKDETQIGRLVYMIYREAFRRLGIEMVYRFQPPRRGEVEAGVGNVDGDLGRGPDYGATHPMLVRVDEPLLSLPMSAYTLDPTLRVQGWDSLKGARYRIEYRMGTKVVEEQLAKVTPDATVSSVATTVQGMKKLAAGRSDVYVDFDDYVDTVAHAQAFPGSERIRRAGPIMELPVHAYLNRRHAALAVQLAAMLREMKREGVVAKCRAQLKSGVPGDCLATSPGRPP